MTEEIEYNIIASGKFVDKLIILVDMDQTIAGFDEELFRRWNERWSDIPIPYRNTYTYQNEDDYERMKNIAGESGFFESLPMYDGVAATLNSWQNRENVEIFLCTKPLDKRDPCVIEKYKWVEKNLGPQWKDRVIITNDKTLCYGHILIDDLPVQSGINSSPFWIHIYFDQLYNNIFDKPRITNWNNLELIIDNDQWLLQEYH